MPRNGVGPTFGYPALELDPRGDPVDGLIFHSEELAAHWGALDAFEGDAYERVATVVERADGSTVEAFVYRIRAV